MPDPALPQPRTVTALRTTRRLVLAPRKLAPSGALGLGTQPLGTSSLGSGRDITVAITDVRVRKTIVTARMVSQ